MPYEVISLEPNKASIREYSDSKLKAGEIKVETMYGSPKHGTEFTLFRGVDPHLTNRFDDEYNLFLENEPEQNVPYFMTPGNMWVGKIVEIGLEVSGLEIGQRVAGYGPLRETHILKAENALIMPKRMTWQEAVCYDAAHFALGGIRDSEMKMGDTVAVFGLGAIGLLTAQMAKRSGASLVIAVDPIEQRREVALAAGVDLTFNPSCVDVGFEIKKATDKLGADVIIETSGFYPALQQAVRGIKYAGNIAVVGWFKECTGGLHLGLEAHFNQPNLIFSRACSEPNRLHGWSFDRVMKTCWEMLAAGWFDCENIVNPVVPFAEAAKAYMEINENPDNSTKLGVDFQGGLQ